VWCSHTRNKVLSDEISSTVHGRWVMQKFQTHNHGLKYMQGLLFRLCGSVCLFAVIFQKPHIRTSQNVFCTCYLWPWLSPPLTTVQYVMYFRFCGWGHFFTWGKYMECATWWIIHHDSPGGATKLHTRDEVAVADCLVSDAGLAHWLQRIIWPSMRPLPMLTDSYTRDVARRTYRRVRCTSLQLIGVDLTAFQPQNSFEGTK